MAYSDPTLQRAVDSIAALRLHCIRIRGDGMRECLVCTGRWPNGDPDENHDDDCPARPYDPIDRGKPNQHVVEVTGCRDCPFAGADPHAGDVYNGGHGGPCKHPAREKRELINPHCATFPKDCQFVGESAVFRAVRPKPIVQPPPPPCPACGKPTIDVNDIGDWVESPVEGVAFGWDTRRVRVHDWLATHVDGTTCKLTKEQADAFVAERLKEIGL